MKKFIVIIISFTLMSFNIFYISKGNEYMVILEDTTVHTSTIENGQNMDLFYFMNLKNEFKYAISIYRLPKEYNSLNLFSKELDDVFNLDCEKCTNIIIKEDNYCHINGRSFEFIKEESGVTLRGKSFYTKGSRGIYMIAFLTSEKEYDLYTEEYKAFMDNMNIL